MGKHMQSQISESEKMDYLSIGEASEYLGISIDTLRRWEKKGRITTYRSPGGHRYFQKKDLKGLFNAKYTRDAPTKRGKKEIEPEIKTETVKPEVKENEKISTKHGIVIEEKSVFDPKFVDSAEKFEIVDWSEKYANKEGRKVRIPLIRPVKIKISRTQTTSNHQSVQQVRPIAALSQLPQNSQTQTTPISQPSTNIPPIQNKRFAPNRSQVPHGTGISKFEIPLRQNSILQPSRFNQTPQKQELSKDIKQRSPQPKSVNIKKIAIITTSILLLLGIILFFYWYSRPKILSPIP